MSEPNEPQATPQPNNPTPTTDGASPSLVGGTPVNPAEPQEPGADDEPGTPPEPQAAPEPEPLKAEDIQLPEGFEADPELINGFVETLNNNETTPAERASALLDLHNKVLQTAAEQMETTWQQTQKEWQDAARALPELGGDNLDRTLGDVAKVVDRYGGKDVREAFDLTGAGNHPAVIQMFAKIAKDLNESAPVSGEPPSGAPKSRAERMFGS